MTDIWGEKPNRTDERYWEKTGLPTLAPIMFRGKLFADEMDAWLEKLKAHYVGLENGYKSCWESFNELLEENSELKEKSEKCDAVEALMREQSYIDMNQMNQYSVKPLLSYRGTKLVESIMAIIFPDEMR